MKTYEDFVLEYTGRDMEYHKRYEIWGPESGRAAWDAAIAAERERCASLCEALGDVASQSSTGCKRAGAISMADSCAKMIRASE